MRFAYPPSRAAPPTYRFGYDPTARPATVTTQRLTSDGQYLVDTAFNDGLGRVIQTRSPSSTEGQVTVASTSYDEAGAVFQESAAYDIPGSIATYEAPDWGAVPSYSQTTYDQYSQPDVISRMAAGDELWQTTVDRSGWTVTTTGPDDQATIQTANGHGETVSVTERSAEPDSQTAPATSTYLYDASGTVRQMTDAGGAVTTVTTNLLGWKTGLDDPSSGVWSYAYDDVGQVEEERDPNGNVVTFGYDDLNRLRSRTANDETVAEWTYQETDGELGRLQGTTSVTPEGPVEVTYDHDDRNRITDQSWTIPTIGTHSMQWAFDATDQVTEVTYPENDGQSETVVYGYDRAGRVETVSGDQDYQTAASYDAQGRVATQDLADGISRTVTHDPRTLFLTGMSATRDAETIQGLTYVLDDSERVTRITDAVNGSQSQCFDYSDRNELARAYTTGAEVCDDIHDPAVGADAYDHTYATQPNGNLTDRGTRTLTYDDPALPHAVTATSDGITLDYDDAGNMIERVDGDQSFTFDFDTDNRLASADGPDGTTTYLYDADGHRMAAVGPEGTTAWLNEYAELTVGTDEQLGLTSRYMSGEQLLAESDSVSGQTTTMLPDHLGSTVVAVPEGEAPQFIRYDPWGCPTRVLQRDRPGLARVHLRPDRPRHGTGVAVGPQLRPRPWPVRPTRHHRRRSRLTRRNQPLHLHGQQPPKRGRPIWPLRRPGRSRGRRCRCRGQLRQPSRLQRPRERLLLRSLHRHRRRRGRPRHCRGRSRRSDRRHRRNRVRRRHSRTGRRGSCVRRRLGTGHAGH